MNQARPPRTEPEALKQITEILMNDPEDLRGRLQREIILNALKCKRDELDVQSLKLLNRALSEFRYASKVFKPYRGTRKVSVFGSSRTLESDAYYQLAVAFGRLMASSGFMIITGAGEGIMRAGIEGAGREHSFGVNILLPANPANRFIQEDPKLVTFRYFFTRKLFFAMEAHAFALFPGGFGTMDELFEVITLLQTGKAPPMPIVLMELPGEKYWESLDQFIRNQLLARGYVSPEDTSFYTIAKSPEEGLRWIQGFYAAYHSSRQVGDSIVLRLERELTDEQITRLNESFMDLAGGRIARTPALPQELDEPELLTKPRIVFPYNRRSPGRLNQLIIALNTLAQSAAVAISPASEPAPAGSPVQPSAPAAAAPAASIG